MCTPGPEDWCGYCGVYFGPLPTSEIVLVSDRLEEMEKNRSGFTPFDLKKILGLMSSQYAHRHCWPKCTDCGFGFKFVWRLFTEVRTSAGKGYFCNFYPTLVDDVAHPAVRYHVRCRECHLVDSATRSAREAHQGLHEKINVK